MRPAALIAPLLLVVISCSDGTPAAQAQRLWTMADLELSLAQIPGCVNPAGLDCDYFVNKGVNNNDVLQFKLAFSESAPMGYITTDFWANYPQIWLEPMYILVTAWNADPPASNRLKDAMNNVTGPIFSVGPQSAFWSPFWQVFYVEVPVGTPPTKYTSARQLFDDHLVMHPGPNRFASIGPSTVSLGSSTVSLPSADDISNKIMPTVGDYLVNGIQDLAGVVAASKALTGWLDGAAVSYVDFGTDNFDVGPGQVIEDVPLFLFRKYDANGVLKSAGAPNVGGVAPLFSHLPGRISVDMTSKQPRPQFGALWRLHIVTLPKTAQIFLKENADDAIVLGASQAVMYAKVNRVVLDDSCFKTLSDVTDTCIWLDSQRAIEDNLGDKAITRTDFQPACPFVMFNGLPVHYQ